MFIPSAIMDGSYREGFQRNSVVLSHNSRGVEKKDYEGCQDKQLTCVSALEAF